MAGNYQNRSVHKLERIWIKKNSGTRHPRTVFWSFCGPGAVQVFEKLRRAGGVRSAFFTVLAPTGSGTWIPAWSQTELGVLKIMDQLAVNLEPNGGLWLGK